NLLNNRRCFSAVFSGEHYAAALSFRAHPDPVNHLRSGCYPLFPLLIISATLSFTASAGFAE
ncbi:hypothetical protein, partial [Acinetobacter baumannii]|uniref:hypothetical protein n=1 Tax=Acinetobacter baumannii TaxID=470 RepID=UPI002277818B